MTSPSTSKSKSKSDSKSGEKEPEAKQPAPSATPDRGEEDSLEKQTKPAFSPSQQHGGGRESPGMGPGPATSVIGSNEGVAEAAIPDGPSAGED